jgi:hypothetical protein
MTAKSSLCGFQLVTALIHLPDEPDFRAAPNV